MKINLKAKVAALTAAAFIAGGTVTFAATTNYYADLLARQQEQMEEEITKFYTERYKEVGQMQHRDMVTSVELARQEILEEAERYAEEVIQKDAYKRRKEHAEAIQKEKERIMAEIKEMIDNLGDVY